MWQQQKKESAIFSLGLLLSLATTPMAADLFVRTPVLAQSATESSPPSQFTQTEPVQQQPPENNLGQIPWWWLLLPVSILILLLIWIVKSSLWAIKATNPSSDANPTDVENEIVLEEKLPAANPQGDFKPELPNLETLDSTDTSPNFPSEELEEESPWDIEAPVNVVNPYPQLPDLSLSNSEASKEGEFSFDFERENSKNQNPSNTQTTFSGISEEDIFNQVADAAEPTKYETEDETDIFADSATFLETDTQSQDQLQDSTKGPSFNLDGERSVVLKPRNSEWAYANWYIDETCQQILANNGICELALRLYDVTDLDLSYERPQLVKQYQLESNREEKYIPIPRTSSDYIAAIGYISQSDRWVSIARSPRVRVFNTPVEDPTPEPLFNIDGERNIILHPCNSEWACANWYIDETCQQTLATNGILDLELRLYDVTDLDLSYETPELVQQYQIESGRNKKYISIPRSNKDYLAAIGYVNPGDRWVSIACSPKVRIFGTPLTDTIEENQLTTDSKVTATQSNQSEIILKSRTPKWAYAAWYISTTDEQTLQNKNISQLYLRLYDVTGLDQNRQTSKCVQQYECDEIIRDRYIAIPAVNREYIAEIGYFTQDNFWQMFLRSEKICVFSRPQTDFWFLTDTELIIHGSTEPGATVNISGKPINIKPDGTFHLRLPFSTNSIDYMITATAANGEQSTTIQKKFSHQNLET
ncbi:DUF4912 domain-containing protein [Chrysosporum bergii ANA360D]|uniref:DUF4912 domain-containing protein n=1 Tax=Chrysosporum bergii ANA360D TaxID=617107 RepID=A0AA43GRY8_9CYAN|nr:DUF4912 domain-containing protein [Chrysosporum bergii]MDH6060559.1 DUF4912 domain-containing protein [Chrysosporum bergii ANA360D]